MAPRYWPLARGHMVTFPFGPRADGFHAGADFGWEGGSAGLPVHAVAGGTVIYAGAAQGYGGPDPAGWLVVDHPAEDGGGCSEYGHIVREVALGQRVEAGQRIGRINPDTRSNGGVAPHLHLSVMPREYNYKAKIDPLPWLSGAAFPGEQPPRAQPAPAAGVGALLADYSAGVPSAGAVKAAGFAGAIRYVSPPREPWMAGKPLTRAEVDDFRAHGLAIVSVWQHGKRDFDRGFEGGAADAREALRLHAEAGGPESAPIYAAIDQSPSLAEWNATAAPYLRGFQSVVGKPRMGVYANAPCIDWAREDGIGTFFWQHNWGSGGRVHEAAHLHQFEIDKQKVAGIGIDRNRVLKVPFGAWGQDAVPQPKEKPMGQRRHGDPVWLADVLRGAGLNVIEEPGWKNRGHGDMLEILGILCHHTAGGGVNDWRVVRDGRADLPGPLAHLVLEKDGTYRVICAGIGYHAGNGSWPGWPTNKGNYHTIGIEAVSRGVPDAQGRYDWTPAQLDAYVRGCAAICRYAALDERGVAGHREYSSEGKIDPAGIDMADFRRQVRHFIDHPQGDDVTKEQADRIEQKIDWLLTQLGGPAEPGVPTRWEGWKQLGFLTLVDAVAAVGENLGIEHFKPVREPQGEQE